MGHYTDAYEAAYGCETATVPVYTDECSEAAIGLLCGKSDCIECGAEVARQLRDGARRDWPGLLSLVREVVRIAEGYSDPPATAVTPGDVARAVRATVRHGVAGEDVRLQWPADYIAGMCAAWSDGMIEAVAGLPIPTTERDCYPAGPQITARYFRWCYALGRASLSLSHVGARLRQRRESEEKARRWHAEQMIAHRVEMAERAIAFREAA